MTRILPDQPNADGPAKECSYHRELNIFMLKRHRQRVSDVRLLPRASSTSLPALPPEQWHAHQQRGSLAAHEDMDAVC